MKLFDNSCQRELLVNTEKDFDSLGKYIQLIPAGVAWEAWWLNGSAPDCCPAVPGSNPAAPQPTADCPSPGGLPPGMALGRGLTSVRGTRGKNCEKWTAGSPKKYIKKKKRIIPALARLLQVR
jgi:hypothetical protein